MKQSLAEKVAKYAEWEPESLEIRIRWRVANMEADRVEIQAMRKAQRVQRKRGSHAQVAADREA